MQEGAAAALVESGSGWQGVLFHGIVKLSLVRSNN